jgi:general secretion pathway protein D
VATNLVYFDIDIDVTTEEGVTTTNVDSEIQNVPEGVLINVLPSIDLDKRTVSMAVRPTITNVDQFVSDPGVELNKASILASLPATVSQDLVDAISNVTSPIPVVDVQEFDSVVDVPSGSAVVMGGLMKDRMRSSENGLPIVSEVPLIGSLFKSHTDDIEKTELVIFLKATIIEGSNVHQTDKELYKMFGGDRRPFDL